MLKVDELLELVKLCLISSKVEKERPLSMLIIASVGAGKSEIVSKFAQSDGVLYATDITTFIFKKDYIPKIAKGNIHHIIIPDLIIPLSHRKDIRDGFVAFMNGLIEEGIARVESRETQFSAVLPVRCGLIACISKQDLDRKAEEWGAIGFLSRLLPLSYGYTKQSADEIFRSIIAGEYFCNSQVEFTYPLLTEVSLPEDLGIELIKVSKDIKDAQDEFGFRRLKQIQTLAKSMALSSGRTVVSIKDLERIKQFQKYFSYSCKARV